jgi:hypothetical protein
MKVYIVFLSDYESWSIVGAFSTREKAAELAGRCMID